MCGITGILDLDGCPADPELVRRMVAPLRHRGPDESGVYVEGPVGLGHVRLSIIDLCGGRQPMHNEDGSISVSFNGEIFNYVELQKELHEKGHHFATRSDTEVILHAYEEYGEDCVQRFNGQWAFAIWDARRQSLFLSRDRLGIRPLFYTHVGDQFLFASEIKSLFVHPGVVREIDPVGLDQLFTFWSAIPPQTVFRGIRELPPGHNLTIEDGTVRTGSYWQLNFEPAETSQVESERADRLIELLHSATRLRLRSDVPVGAYVSGGLDSAITTAFARQFASQLRTFSITFDDAEFDESEYQRQVVEFLQTDHQTIHCRTEDIARVFPEVIWHTERPILRTAPAPMYLLSQLVHGEGYRVVLTGEGADEMFGGYDIFKEAKVRRFWARQPDSPRRAALLAKLYPYLPRLQSQPASYRNAFFRASSADLSNPLFSHLPRWELTTRVKAFFSDDLQAELAGRDVYGDCRQTLPNDFDRWHPFCQAQYLEATMLMPGYILSSQGDRMSMANSVEGRYPFLDHRLVEFAATLPPRMKMRGLDEKHLLKRAATGIIPDEVLARTKQPYRAPDAACFLPGGGLPEPGYVEELLSSKRIAEDGIFHPEAIRHLVDKFRKRRAVGMKDNMALVGILSTQLLIEQFVHGFPPADSVDVPITHIADARTTVPACDDSDLQSEYPTRQSFDRGVDRS